MFTNHFSHRLATKYRSRFSSRTKVDRSRHRHCRLESLEDRNVLSSTPFFMGLGDLPGDIFSSTATGVSDDGLIVVGAGNASWGNLVGTEQAFRYTIIDGPQGIGVIEGLGVVEGATKSVARAVSADGLVVVGQSLVGETESFIWKEGVMSAIPGLPGSVDYPPNTTCSAVDVSNDGSVVVGQSMSANGLQGYYWNANTNQLVGMGDFDGGTFYSSANSVSGDGTIVAGTGNEATKSHSTPQNDPGRYVGFTRTVQSAMTRYDFGIADISDDASVIAGTGGMRWTQATGWIHLGSLPGGDEYTDNRTVSGDGRVIGGSSSTANMHEAFIWDEQHGMRRLQDVLEIDYGLSLAGWTLAAVNDISYDGSTLVGFGYNSAHPGLEAFVAHIPPAPGITVSPASGLATDETGATTTFSVVLKTQPTADVTIGVSSTNTSEGTVNVASLVFTTSNWNVPQIVTVTGVDDAVADGNQPYTIQLAPAVSADSDYNGLDAADVTVTNLDNDTPATKFFVVDDGTANQTFEYGVSGSPVESYALGTANATPRGVATTAAGDRVWIVDANRTVYVYDAAGAALGSWSAGSLASNAVPEGIATNGTDIWIVDNKSDKVFRYTGAATRTSGSQTAASSFSLASGNTNPKDIVTDGTSLWVVNDATTDKVFKYALGGTAQGNWTIDAANKAPTGITLDPTGPSDIWIVDNGTDRVYQYMSAASRTSGSQSAAVSFALAAGNTNAQGIADPPVPGTATAVATVVADVARGVESRMLTHTENWTGSSGRVLTNHKPFKASAAGASRLVQSARADLLLAREQVFDAFDHTSLDMRDKWLRSTGYEEFDGASCSEDHDADFDLALDAAFASVA